MEQALVNVVKNAIEAIDRDGSITVRTAMIERRPLGMNASVASLAAHVRCIDRGYRCWSR
jgi:nitrogen-specific signal transduction histidine kinase